jgi:hypothetical protein
MISAPGSRLLEIAINDLGEFTGELSPMETLSYCGAIYLSQTIRNNRNLLGDIAIMPSQYFYPWPNFMIHNDSNRYSWITDKSEAIHHWEVSWIKSSIVSRVLTRLRGFVI